MTKDEIIQRSQEAQALLQNMVLNLAFANVENDCMKRWRDTPVRDTEAREKIWFIIKSNDAVKLELENMISAGKMAQAEIDLETKKRDFERAKEAEVERQTGMPFSNGEANA